MLNVLYSALIVFFILFLNFEFCKAIDQCRQVNV
jgi:hypothetical protein